MESAIGYTCGCCGEHHDELPLSYRTQAPDFWAARQPFTIGLKPLVELEPTDHLLAVEQRTGITMARVQEIAELVLHPGSRPR